MKEKIQQVKAEIEASRARAEECREAMKKEAIGSSRWNDLRSMENFWDGRRLGMGMALFILGFDE